MNSKKVFYQQLCKEKLEVEDGQLNYYVFGDKLKNQAYDLKAEPIRIFTKNKEMIDLIDFRDYFKKFREYFKIVRDSLHLPYSSSKVKAK